MGGLLKLILSLGSDIAVLAWRWSPVVGDLFRSNTDAAIGAADELSKQPLPQPYQAPPPPQATPPTYAYNPYAYRPPPPPPLPPMAPPPPEVRTWPNYPDTDGTGGPAWR